MSVSHIAGIGVTIGGRYLRQRCAWCDEVLIDDDLAMIAVPVGQDPRPATWQIGATVRQDGGASVTVEGEKLPEDFCGGALFLDPSDFKA